MSNSKIDGITLKKMMITAASNLEQTKEEINAIKARAEILNNNFILLGIVLMSFFQITYTHAGFTNTIFKSEALDLYTWLEILVISAGVIVVVELKKIIYSKFVK